MSAPDGLPFDNPDAYGSRVYRTRGGELRQVRECGACGGRGWSWERSRDSKGRRRKEKVECEPCRGHGSISAPI